MHHVRGPLAIISEGRSMTLSFWPIVRVYFGKIKIILLGDPVFEMDAVSTSSLSRTGGVPVPRRSKINVHSQRNSMVSKSRV